MSRRAATAVLTVIMAAAVALIALEIGAGTMSYGELESRPACSPAPAYPGDGLDSALQRIVLDGLQGAACELGATREELVLSLAPSTVRPKTVRWDDETIQRAVRSGLVRAIDDAERRGSLPGWAASVLRPVAERAPVTFLVDGGEGVWGAITAARNGDLGPLTDLLRRIDPGDLVDDLRDRLGIG